MTFHFRIFEKEKHTQTKKKKKEIVKIKNNIDKLDNKKWNY